MIMTVREQTTHPDTLSRPPFVLDRYIDNDIYQSSQTIAFQATTVTIRENLGLGFALQRIAIHQFLRQYESQGTVQRT